MYVRIGIQLTTKTSRLNMRVSDQALFDLKRAAEISQQDLTSFVLDAALEKVRRIFVEEHIIRIPVDEYDRLIDRLNEPMQRNERFALFYSKLKAAEDSGELVVTSAKPAAGA